MIYSSILDDLMKMINICATSLTPASIDVKFFSELFDQTCTLITIRQKMMGMYRMISTSNLSPNYETLIGSINSISEEYKNKLFHPYFELLKFSFMFDFISFF